MRIDFASNKLRDLYTQEKGQRKYPPGVVDAFFDVMAEVRAAVNESDLYAMRHLQYHKLEGTRQHQHALKLTGKWRLIVERIEDAEGPYLLIRELIDYH